MSVFLSSVSHKVVAKFYFGNNYVSRTMAMLASFDLRMDDKVITGIEDVMNIEHANISQS